MKSNACLSYKAMTLRYIKSKENLCDYSSQHYYKDLLKFKKLIHYVYFVLDDIASKTPTIRIIINTSKNDKRFHQVIKLTR